MIGMNIKRWIRGKIEKVKNNNNQKYYELHKDEYPIEQFKAKYLGQKCFIIGNGPSLLGEDLDKIHKKGYVTFASNKVYRIFQKTNWRPTYVTIADPQFIRDNTVLAKIVDTHPEMLFVRSQFAKDVRNCKCNICAINSEYDRSLLDNPKFSMRCDEIIYDIATVTYFSIQLAAYMGFDEIYLLGMDNRYAYSMLRNGTVIRNEGVANYFGENNIVMPSPDSAVATWEMDVAYGYAEKYSREHGFRIFNATRGGFLETFERANLEDVLSANNNPI